MRHLASGILLCLTLRAAHAGTDTIVNDRTGNPIGDNQINPSACFTHSAAYGDFLVCVFDHVRPSPQIPEFIVSISTLPPGFTQQGMVPAPSGFQWLEDPIVRAFPASSESTGGFLLVGQLRSLAGPPFTIGLGSIRGVVTSPLVVGWDAPQLLETFGQNPINQRFISALAMDVSSSDDAAHMMYFNLNSSTTTAGALWHRVSHDKGLTWSGPIPIGNDTLQYDPRSPIGVQCGSRPGDVAFFWKELDRATKVSNTTVSRASTDGGVTLAPPVVVMPPPMYTTPTGPHGSQLYFGSASSFARTPPGDPERYFYSVGVPLDWSQSRFPPDGPGASHVGEVEPDGSIAQAVPVPGIGSFLYGTFPAGAVPDTDYFAFPLVVGQPVMVWPDSITVGQGIMNVTWRGPGGIARIVTMEGTQFGGVLPLAFTPPVSGTWYLEVAKRLNFGGDMAYRITTGPCSARASGARDQRDLFLTSSTGGAPWTAPINLSAQVTPAGFEESGVTMSGNSDGYLYAAWTDWSESPGTELARRRMSRSPDGGTTWESPVTLSSASSEWAASLGPVSGFTSLGWHAGSATNGFDLFDVWPDARNSDPDVYGRWVRRRLRLDLVTPDTLEAHPGETVVVQVRVQNLDDVFGWNLRLDATLSRAWPAPAATSALSADQNAWLPLAVTVPDSAATGVVTLDGTVASVLNPSLRYLGWTTPIHVLPPTTDVERVPQPLALSPISPNPASATARVGFSLSRPGAVRLVVLGVDGRRVRQLVDGERAAGGQSIAWEGVDDAGRRVAPGAYFVHLEAEGRTLTRRMVWVR